MKRFDERKRLQERTNSFPLHADAAAVNESHLAEPARVRLREVVVRDVPHFRGAKRMQVEHVRDRNLDGLFALVLVIIVVHARILLYSALSWSSSITPRAR